MSATVRIAEARIYKLSGLRIASQVEIDGAETVGASSDVPDATIAYGSVPEHLPGQSKSGPNWEVREGEVLLRVPGVARFLIARGQEILVEPAPGRGPADFGIFITGSVLGILLHQRGCFAVHASAVAVDGEAVIFCGPATSGKSVLAAALSAAGYPLVSDDICLMEPYASPPMVGPDGRRLKLWADTVARLSLDGGQRVAIRAGVQKYWVEPPTAGSGRPLPLRSICFLHWAKLPNTTEIESMTRLDTVTSLRASAYRRRLIRVLGREQAWLEACASVAKNTQAWRLTRERQFDALPRSVRVLEKHWAR